MHSKSNGSLNLPWRPQGQKWPTKLQRMSSIVKDGDGRYYVVVKGSPEAIGERVQNKHPSYDDKSMKMAKKGLRVIGLGFKKVRQLRLHKLARCLT